MTCVASHGLEIEKHLFYHLFLILVSSKLLKKNIICLRTIIMFCSLRFPKLLFFYPCRAQELSFFNHMSVSGLSCFFYHLSFPELSSFDFQYHIAIRAYQVLSPSRFWLKPQNLNTPTYGHGARQPPKQNQLDLDSRFQMSWHDVPKVHVHGSLALFKPWESHLQHVCQDDLLTKKFRGMEAGVLRGQTE